MCLVFVAFIGSMAVPAHADGLTWINVLDYAMPNNGDSTRFTLPAGSTTVYFALPVGINLNLADILVRTTSSDLTATIGGRELTSILVDTTYTKRVRLSGFCGGAQYQNIPVVFSTSTACQVFIDKFIVSTLWWSNFQDIGKASLWIGNTTNTYTQPSKTSPVSFEFTPAASGINPWNIALSCDNWQKYDYLRFDCYTTAFEITSITAQFGTREIDYEVTQIYDGTADMDSWYYEITLDLSKVNHSVSDVPEVFICGAARNGTNCEFILAATVGFIQADVNLDNHFLRQYFKSFSGFLSSIDLAVADITPMYEYLQTLPSAIGQLISAQTSALQGSLVDLTSSVRGMFTSLSGWISDQTAALSSKLDEVISALNPESDTSGADSLLDQSQQIHDFEVGHQEVLSNGLSTMQNGAVISRPHFASALAFIGVVSSTAFDKLGFMQVIYTLPLVIGLIMFMASRAPGATRVYRSRSKPSRNIETGGDVL